jgi:hypothetical protein
VTAPHRSPNVLYLDDRVELVGAISNHITPTGTVRRLEWPKSGWVGVQRDGSYVAEPYQYGQLRRVSP